jgi:fermentation-respiration switch protein FrsA (DUF1100 family)
VSVTERDVDFRSGEQQLAGTLTLPAGGGPFPAALLISGSGPLDRDSNHRRFRAGIGQQLAHALAAAGIASLRYDKRGVGGSPGDWRRAGLFDNVDDASAALTALAERPEVDTGRVFVIGHSEGAVLATALAGRDAPLAGVVLLSGTARPGSEVLLWQTERVVPTLPAPVRGLLRLLRVDPVKKVAANHRKVLATTRDVVRMGGARVNARWFREYLTYDPAADLKRLDIPVLAITGSKDLQVDPGDLELIERLAPGPVETYLAPDVTHVLRRQPGAASLRAYRKEMRDPVDADLLARVVRWLQQHTAPNPHPPVIM